MRLLSLILGLCLGIRGVFAAETNAPVNPLANPPAIAPTNALITPLAAPPAITPANPPAIASANNRSLALEECIQLALKHNFDVQIQRLNPAISRYNLHMGYAAYDPNLQIEGRHNFNQSPGQYFAGIGNLPGQRSDANAFDTSISGVLPTGLTYSLGSSLSEQYGLFRGTPFDNSVASAGIASLRQPLLKNMWIDQSRYTIMIAKKDLRINELGFKNQVMTTITSVEQAYYDLIYAKENVRVQEKALELARRLLSENKKRVEVGALAPLDEKQAESQVAASQANLLLAQQQLSNAQNVMKNLLSDNYMDWDKVVVEPAESLTAVVQPFSKQDSWTKGMTLRPDLLQARQSVEKLNISVRYSRNQLFPQLDLMGSFGYSANASANPLVGAMGEFSTALGQIRDFQNPSYMYGATMTIPLTNRRARDSYKISKAQQAQALLQLKQLEQNIMVQIENAIVAAQTAFESVDATKQQRIYAQAALDAEQKKLENGKSTSFVVLSLQRDLTAANTAEINALASYNKALAALALAEGYTLERRHIDFEVK